MRAAVVAGLLGLVTLAASGCTDVLGDFDIGNTPADASPDVIDGGGTADGGDGGRPPPPVPGKPGFDLTAGGNISKSTGYKLFGAVGEGPGSNVIGKSPKYTLKGGVVAVTQ